MDDPASFLVIGLGNEFRGDDGCGPLVARKISQKRLAGVRLIHPMADSTGLVMEWDGAEAAFLIDCVCSGAPLGTIHRFEPLVETIPEQLSQPTSTHRFGITQVVRLAQTLGRLPQRLIVYGIEGQEFGHGTGVTGAVAEAVNEVADRIVNEMALLVAGLKHD